MALRRVKRMVAPRRLRVSGGKFIRGAMCAMAIATGVDEDLCAPYRDLTACRQLAEDGI
jgi:hypothetical protein